MLPRLRRRLFKYTSFIKPLIILIVVILVLSFLVRLLSPIFQFAQKNNFSPNFVYSLIFNDNSYLKSTSGRTNILILGIGGGTHEGPDLTDSMIFLSIDFKNNDAVMVSLPRDIWSPTLKDKINSAYAYGEAKKKGGGLILSKSVVEEVVGQPVHYAWLIDFSGFKKLIDLVGGLDIGVDKSFDDYKYPIEGKENDDCGGIDPDFKCRYEHLHFDSGLQHMEGERALKYVRSRFAEGVEGTDFARSQRQQKVILALKDKILHHSKFTDLNYDKALFKAFDDATDTDMNWSETLLFGKFFLRIKQDKIIRPIIDSSDEQTGKKGFLINPPTWQYNGVWVLIPRKGENDFSEIVSYIKCFLVDPKCSMTP